MKQLARWAKFGTVGTLGALIQLAALALFSRVMPRHYLCATTAAIELTLVHNFFWHSHYTWHDRPRTTRIRQLFRFHVSSGLISLLGNLALMRVLVGEAHIHVLAANFVAVLCCSVPNFLLGNVWVFASS